MTYNDGPYDWGHTCEGCSEYEEQWIIGGLFDKKQEASHCQCGAIKPNQELLLADTGACKTVFRKQAFPATQAREPRQPIELTTIMESPIDTYGEKDVKVQMPSGKKAALPGLVTDVSTSALSIGEANGKGLTSVFGPGGAYLTKWEPPVPSDAEFYLKRGNLFYLPVSEQDPRTAVLNVIAPVVEIDEMFKPFDVDYEEYQKAIETGGDLPFKIFTKKVEHARMHRLATQEDPCSWQQVFRRATKDTNTQEVIQDVTKQTVPAGFDWRSPVEGAPRDITVDFLYTDDAEESQPVLDGNAIAKSGDVQVLPVPIMPSYEEVMKHNLTHAEYQPWCKHCVAGRARGNLHTSDLTVGENDRYEFDYTYWS